MTTKITQSSYDVVRTTHRIDATGKSMGRLASAVAQLLSGKGKTSYTRHVDHGDRVMIEHVAQVKLTGKKLDQKKYYRYSGYPGGLKTTKASELFEKNPGEMLRRAIYKMLPKNSMRESMMKRLTIK